MVETQSRQHFWTGVGSSRLKSVNSHRDRGACGRETQTFWTRVGSSRLKSVNSHRDRGGHGRNAVPSSLLDWRWVFAFEKCQQSQGSGGGCGREAQTCHHFKERVKEGTERGD